MSRDTLIVVNYQREIPPFMLTQIEIAKDIFPHVIYVTREMIDNDNSRLVDFPNVEVVQFKPRHGSLGNVEKLCGVFRFGGAEDFRRAVSSGRLNGTFIKDKLRGESISNQLLRIIRSLVNECGAENAVLLSTWFSDVCIAACKAKRLFPALHVVSYAHSFEVQFEKNKWCDLDRNAFKHRYCDEIFFISRKVMDAYQQQVVNKLGLPTDNVHLIYLGCRKREDGTSKSSTDEGLHLVSCSHTGKVKRIGLIADALDLVKCPVRWTHLGGGSRFDEVRRRAEAISNPLVQVELAGKVDNGFVHSYYVSTACDLFVNVSSMEGLPVSLMECMAYGIPAIATDVGGNSEIVIDGKTGILLSGDPTPEEVADAIERFAAFSIEAKGAMRANCIELWQREFDSDKQIGGFFEELRIA